MNKQQIIDELVAALEKILPLLHSYDNGPWEEARNAVIEAIKKAKGE